MDKKKIAFIVISVLVCLLVYLPTPKGVDPEQYHPNQFSSLDDLNVDKNKLNNAVFLTTPATGAQDVQIDKNGYIYSGLHDGSIIRIKPDNSETVVLGKSQGPIFGIDINKNGNKIVLADQLSGIKLFDITTNTFQFLVSEYNGSKFVSPNGVVFGENEDIIYFTVSSQIIPMSQFHQMLLYSQGSGRIFEYNLKTKKLQLLASELYFVNGIQYSSKENCLFFVQTSRSRLMRLDLQPEKRGNKTVVLQNILGYPDNVKLSESGDLWVAIPALRDQFSNIVDHNSIIRRVILNLRMPLGLFIKVANMKYAGGIKVNPKNGEIIQYFFGNSKNIDCISGINEGNGKLYLSSLSKNKIAIVNIEGNSVKIDSNKNQQIISNPPKQSSTQETKQSKVEKVAVQQAKQTKMDQKILKKQNNESTEEQVIQKQLVNKKQEALSPPSVQENKISSNQQRKEQKNVTNQETDKKQQVKTNKQANSNEKVQKQPTKQEQKTTEPKVDQSTQQNKIDPSDKPTTKTTTTSTKTSSTTTSKASQGSKAPNKTTPQNQSKSSNQGNTGNNHQYSGTPNNQGSTNTHHQGSQNKGYTNQGKGGKGQTNNYRSNEL